MNKYNICNIFNFEGLLEKKYYFKNDKKNIDNNELVIRLTIKQLVYIGIHIGHLKKNSQLLSS